MEHEEQAPASDSEAPSNRTLKKRVLIGLLVLAACEGVVMVFVPEVAQTGSAAQLASTLPFLFLILLWCHYDAADHDFSLGRLMAVSLVLFMAIAFPIYLFRSRGFFSGLKTLALACLFLGALAATATIAAIPAYLIGSSLGIVVE